MRKYFIPLAITAFMLLLCACNSAVKKEQTAPIQYAVGLKKDKLHSTVLRSLALRNWIIDDKGNPIKAHYNKGYQHAVVSILVSDYKIDIDTKGSTSSGKPYTPKRYLNYLIKTIKQGEQWAM